MPATEVVRPMVLPGYVMFGWILTHQERLIVEAKSRPEYVDLDHLTTVLDEKNCRANGKSLREID